MDIEIYTPDRVHEIADLFYQSVHAINPGVYSHDQKEAWAPTPPDYEKWSARLKIKQPFLGIIDNRVVGFMELDPDGHIDCTYTHPDFQGRGVASALYEHLEIEAIGRHLNRLYVDASIIAKPFFAHRGFNLIQENNVQRNGNTLKNYTMEKHLSTKNKIHPTGATVSG